MTLIGNSWPHPTSFSALSRHETPSKQLNVSSTLRATKTRSSVAKNETLCQIRWSSSISTLSLPRRLEMCRLSWPGHRRPPSRQSLVACPYLEHCHSAPTTTASRRRPLSNPYKSPSSTAASSVRPHHRPQPQPNLHPPHPPPPAPGLCPASSSLAPTPAPSSPPPSSRR